MYFIRPMRLSNLQEYRLHSCKLPNLSKSRTTYILTQLSIFHGLSYRNYFISLESTGYAIYLYTFQKFVPSSVIKSTRLCLLCEQVNIYKQQKIKQITVIQSKTVPKSFQKIVLHKTYEAIKSTSKQTALMVVAKPFKELYRIHPHSVINLSRLNLELFFLV